MELQLFSGPSVPSANSNNEFHVYAHCQLLGRQKACNVARFLGSVPHSKEGREKKAGDN